MSVRNYKEKLFEALLTMLWRQWTALGIAGQTAVRETGVVLDPEALLVFSSGFARYDQRLYDLILDWLQVHAPQINIQRLKALHAKMTCRDTPSFAYMAAVAAETDPVRWRKPAADHAGGRHAEPAVLFRDRHDVPERFIPKVDPLARSYGWLRNLRRPGRKIAPALPAGTAPLLLRMRGLTGISARAETLLILQNSAPCTVQDISDRSGFIWKSIQDVLAELSAAGLVSVIGGEKRGKRYALAAPEKLLRFFELEGWVFPVWPNIFDALGLLWQTAADPRLAEVSETVFAREIQYLADRTLYEKWRLSAHPVFLQTMPKVPDIPAVLEHL